MSIRLFLSLAIGTLASVAQAVDLFEKHRSPDGCYLTLRGRGAVYTVICVRGAKKVGTKGSEAVVAVLQHESGPVVNCLHAEEVILDREQSLFRLANGSTMTIQPDADWSSSPGGETGMITLAHVIEMTYKRIDDLKSFKVWKEIDRTGICD